MKTTCLIIDDEPLAIKVIESHLDQINDIDVVKTCTNAVDGLNFLKDNKVDLIFLDINLTDGTGFDFLNQAEYSNFKVIFITAYEEFALQALKIGAVDYILKPVDIDELQKAIEKVINLPISTQKQQIETVKQVYDNVDTLILSLQDSFQVIHLKDLMYCESDKGYTTFYLDNGKKHLASKSLKEFEKQLIEHSFTRPHQSFIVNLKFIEKYDKSGTIYLKNGMKIPVSSRKKENFITRLFSWNKR